MDLPGYDAAVRFFYPTEPCLLVEVRRLEVAEGKAGHILCLGHGQLGLLQLLHHYFTMNCEFFRCLWFFKGRAMRQEHSSFCNSGITQPAGEMVECVPIARIQLEHLEYVDGSDDGGRSRAYRVKETTIIIVCEDWLM